MTTERLTALETIEAAIWRELAQAAGLPGHAWRIGVLATQDASGVDARSVVLREVDPDNRELLVFTDSRSPKAAQIRAHPHGVLVLWSAALGWQLRLRVKLDLETSGLAVSSRWARLKMTPAAQDYLSALPPGTPLHGDGPPAPPQRASRDSFAVVTAVVESIDWLELDADGHRRAGFDRHGRRWLVP